MINTIIQNAILFKQEESIVNYHLVSILILVLVFLFVNCKTIKKLVFNATALIILLFVINLFILRHISYKQIGFIPFEALLGPMFFFHIKMFNSKKVSLKFALSHFFPFLGLLGAFIYLLLMKSIFESMFYYYLITLVEGISMLIYGLYAILPRHTRHSIPLRNIISICSITFILNALFTIMNSIAILNSNKYDTHNLYFDNNTFYGITGLLAWVYLLSSINMMVNSSVILNLSLPYFKENAQMQIEPLKESTYSKEKQHCLEFDNSYKKGRLSHDKLSEYEQRLNHLIKNEQLYLKSELTLTDLSKCIKISNHHLTQVLNISIGSNFYQYINKFRIEYAIRLIESKPTGVNLRMLAIDCGFNNQASFNRYFKEITGVKPSAYIKKIIQRSGSS